MKTTTDDGKKCYDLWFILEGKGTSRGSVLRAKCMCKGGRDGGCKHMYYVFLGGAVKHPG